MPTVEELRILVKKRTRERFSAMWFLEPIQVYFSYVLIRLGMNSIGVTVLWLLVAFAGYGVIVLGSPVALIAGALLLYLKTILDGTDGEVARFHKQFITPQQDLESFINGVYLDKVFHIIEKPLWGLSLGLGLYLQTEHWWVFTAGISLATFHSFCRHNGVVKAQLPYKFQESAGKLAATGDLNLPTIDESKKDSIAIRVLDKLAFWIRNGKRLNLIFLCCAITDLMMQISSSPSATTQQISWTTYYTLCAVGSICPFLITNMIVQTIHSNILVIKATELATKE